MSVKNINVKSYCAIWKNIQLPHLNKNHKSPAFLIKGFNWHFNISCTGNEYNIEEFEFGTEFPKDCRSYVVSRYLKTANKYVRINSTFFRSTIIQNYGTDTDIITVLFLLQPALSSIPLDFKDTSMETSGEESLQTLCLESLSADIDKLFDQEEYANITLKCGDKNYAAHRNILASRSEVFSTMFKQDMSEKTSGVVEIADLDPNILEQFLRFLYSGYVDHMSMNTALELYKAGEKYSVTSLKKLCAGYVLDNMSENNVGDALLMADKVGDKELLDGIASFAIRSEGFLNSDEWNKFTMEFPEVALKVYFKYFRDI